jgi:putative transcriptional regulator
MVTSISDISGRFLVAAPGLEDPNFKRTVVLICEHSRDGAFGLIVNKVLMNSFKPLLKALEIERTIVDLPILYGGPVKPDQGYVIYSPRDERYDVIRVTDGLAVTASKEMLYEIAEGKGPEKYLFTLGFSGWAPGQLEEELMTDSWLVAPLDYDLIFGLAVGERWKCAAHSIGIDPDRFVGRSASA